MSRPILKCEIEQLSGWYPNLFLEPHVVACVAVLSQYGPPPAVVEVSCEDIDSPRWPNLSGLRLEPVWLEQTQTQATRLLATIQRKPLVEMAACAVALVLVYHILEEAALDVTQYGDRADYRFLDRPYVLEISGTESLGQFDRRHRDKVAQALANPLGRDALVAVCLFSESGHRARFSLQHWESWDG